MPFDFLDGLDVIFNLLNLDFSKKSSRSENHKITSEKSKYTTELLSGSFLVIASILYFVVFKDPLPEEYYFQNVFVCSVVGFAISLVLFFLLYHLGLFYFKSLFTFIFFSCSVIVLAISLVLVTYYKSGIFL